MEHGDVDLLLSATDLKKKNILLGVVLSVLFYESVY